MGEVNGFGMFGAFCRGDTMPCKWVRVCDDLVVMVDMAGGRVTGVCGENNSLLVVISAPRTRLMASCA